MKVTSLINFLLLTYVPIHFFMVGGGHSLYCLEIVKMSTFLNDFSKFKFLLKKNAASFQKYFHNSIL